MDAPCRPCNRGEHHRCLGRCDCDFPVHTPEPRPPRRPAPRPKPAARDELPPPAETPRRARKPRSKVPARPPAPPRPLSGPVTVSPGTLLVPLVACPPVVTRVLPLPPPPPPPGRRYRDRQDPSRRVVAGRLLFRKARERASRQRSEMFVEAAVRLLDENDWSVAALRLLLAVVEAGGDGQAEAA